MLLEPGADWEAKDKYGRTALFKAAVYGTIAVVKLLMERDEVDQTRQGHCGQIPLLLATGNGSQGSRGIPHRNRPHGFVLSR
jgi:ankyrin repeat protein